MINKIVIYEILMYLGTIASFHVEAHAMHTSLATCKLMLCDGPLQYRRDGTLQYRRKCKCSQGAAQPVEGSRAWGVCTQFSSVQTHTRSIQGRTAEGSNGVYSIVFLTLHVFGNIRSENWNKLKSLPRFFKQNYWSRSTFAERKCIQPPTLNSLLLLTINALPVWHITYI